MSDKKTVLVTGCTSGMGLDLVRYLYETGYAVVLCGRSEEKLQALSGELDDAFYCVCDVNEDGQIKAVFERLKEAGIRLDGLVHCAGTGSNVPIRLFQEEEMRAQMQIHYYAFLQFMKYFYKKTVSNDGASVVGVSSMAVLTKRKGSTLYTAAMNAMNTAVQIGSKEFLKRGIRVNSIMPAYVDTPMNAELHEYVNIDEAQPMGMIPPRAVSGIIEFLLSDKSRYITGANIPVSAGMEG